MRVPFVAFCVLAASITGFATPASAIPSTSVSVYSHDDFYTPFNGTIPAGATGAAASLSWETAGYTWEGSIGLTSDTGFILYNIVTNGDDVYTLYAPGSDNAAIGQLCEGLASVCVVLPFHTPTSLYAAINSVNGGQGIFDGPSSDLVITTGIPEPRVWALMLAGFMLVGVAARRRQIALFA